MTRAVLRVLVGLLLLVACVALLVAGTGDLDALLAAMASVEPALLVPAFGAFLAATLVRAARFRYLLPEAAPYGAFVRITIAYQGLRSLLPAQLGELSYPLLIRWQTGHGRAEGLSDLILVRMVDVALLAVVFAGAAAIGMPHADREIAIVLGIAIIVTSVGGLRFAPRLLRGLRRVLVLARRHRAWPLRRPAQLIRALEVAWRRHGTGPVLGMIGLSICLVLAAWGRIHFQVMALGVAMSGVQTAFVLAANNLLALIPLRAFGGIGIRQAGLLGVFLGFGLGVEQAGALVVLFSATAIAFPLALVPLSWGLFVRASSAAREPAAEGR